MTVGSIRRLRKPKRTVFDSLPESASRRHCQQTKRRSLHYIGLRENWAGSSTPRTDAWWRCERCRPRCTNTGVLWSVMTYLQATVLFDSLIGHGLGGFSDCQRQDASVFFPAACPDTGRPGRNLPNSDIPKVGKTNGLGCFTRQVTFRVTESLSEKCPKMPRTDSKYL